MNFQNLINNYTNLHKKKFINQIKNTIINKNDKKSEAEYMEFLLYKNIKKHKKQIFK